MGGCPSASSTGALVAAVTFSYRAAVQAPTRLVQDMATILLCLQLTIICLCLTGPVFNTQLGILFWTVTGALLGPIQSQSDLDQTIELSGHA